MADFLKYLRMILAGIFILFGLVLVSNIIRFDLESHYRIIIGIIFILYGIYRIISQRRD